MKAVIIAGGEGTRLRPLTYEIPKPMIPVQGRPVVQYLCENFIEYGCDQVIIIVKAKDVRMFANWGLVFLKNNKIPLSKMQLVIERKPLGTFGALRLAQPFLKGEKDFFVTNADEIKDINLHSLYHTHKKNEASIATLAVKANADKESFGNVLYDKESEKILNFAEKSEVKKGKFISLGMYCLNKAIYGQMPKSDFLMLENDLFPKLSNKGRVYGYNHEGQFFPTDDFKKYEEAILKYKHKKPKYKKSV